MSELQICPVILAGGVGTRLWPLSREGYPKQLLPLAGERTLLQETVLRLDGLGEAARERGTSVSVAAPILVCHESHRFFARDQLEEIDRPPGRILLESTSRNTAPALTLAALAALERGGDPALLAMPADHVIADRGRFHRALLEALEVAADGAVITFGIVPTSPESGYGYIRRGDAIANGNGSRSYAIREFVEKPDRETAERYLATDEYFWNAGLFMMRASVWLDAIGRHRPDILERCREAFQTGHADGVFYRVGQPAFTACPADSIDYAVMERLGESASQSAGAAERVIPSAVVPFDGGWSDVGSWPAVMALNERDAAGNALSGDVYQQDTERSLLISEHRLVAALGLKDCVVVETPDAVLVAARDRCQDVRRVVDWLNTQGREEGRNHRRVHRPWGSYEPVDDGERFQVKRLSVKPGAALSLQMHHHRAEHWVVVRGTARVTRGEEQFLLTENESTYIPIGVTHRLENPGQVPLEVIEVQSGCYLGEDDIVRLEDRYNRDREV